jgi:hypothetical protein
MMSGHDRSNAARIYTHTIGVTALIKASCKYNESIDKPSLRKGFLRLLQISFLTNLNQIGEFRGINFSDVLTQLLKQTLDRYFFLSLKPVFRFMIFNNRVLLTASARIDSSLGVHQKPLELTT